MEALSSARSQFAVHDAPDAAGERGDFGELEAKVQRAVAVLRVERGARETAETELLALRQEVERLKTELGTAQAQVEVLSSERETVRLRVEKVLRQMDELI